MMASDSGHRRPSDTPSSVSQRSWTHREDAIRRGITYNFQYIGRLQILESMRRMDFQDRSQVARESISRVCEAAHMRSSSRKKQPVDRRISRVLGQIDLTHAGKDVRLLVNTEKIEIACLATGEIIASYELPDISFASGGDNDTDEFIAYVGKNGDDRWCYVLECGSDLTHECVTTIGQAFDMRYKQFVRGSQASLMTNPSSSSQQQNTVSRSRESAPPIPRYSDQPVRKSASPVPTFKSTEIKKKTLAKIESVASEDYYNDLPGKVPPESELAALAPATDQTVPSSSSRSQRMGLPAPVLSESVMEPKSDLIDWNSPSYVRATRKMEFFEQTSKPSEVPASPAVSVSSDPFDVRKIEKLLEPPLDSFDWFHGNINRQEAESLIQKDGQFLIRIGRSDIDGEAGPKQQFVLSGMHDGEHVHILLVDYDGVIRARNVVFNSVPQLIDLHQTSGLPIVSGENEIFVLYPIPRRTA